MTATTDVTFIIPDGIDINSRIKRGLGLGTKSAAIVGKSVQTGTATPTKQVVQKSVAEVVGKGSTPFQGKSLMSDREVDQQLVERAQAGDKKAFELLVIKYQRKVERLLSRIIRDHAEVEDISQEAFIKAYRALANFRGDSAFYTWLYRIAINTAKNYLVSKGRRAPTTTEFDIEEAEGFEDATGLRDVATPDAELMSKQIGQIVNRTIDNLPEELRTAITLREIDGLSYEEIAQIMDCPIGTVRSRIFRAREAVAEQLRPQLETSKDRRW